MTPKIRSRPTRSKTRKQPHSRQVLPVAQVDSSIEQDWQYTDAKPQGRLMRPEEAEGFVQKRLKYLLQQTELKFGTHRGMKT